MAAQNYSEVANYFISIVKIPFRLLDLVIKPSMAQIRYFEHQYTDTINQIAKLVEKIDKIMNFSIKSFYDMALTLSISLVIACFAKLIILFLPLLLKITWIVGYSYLALYILKKNIEN